MIDDPFFYALVIPAVFLVGLSKGGFGGSVSMIGVPIMALTISPVTAAGIMLPILVVMDVVALLAWRGIFDAEILRLILPASIIGIGLGYFTAAFVSETGVRLAMGILCLVFAGQWFFAARHVVEPRQTNAAKGAFWGIVAGFTSFVSHAGGPPFQVYVMPLRLPPTLFAGTTVIFFAVTNFVKLIPYFFLGQFSAENLTTSALLLPLAPIATIIGVWLVKRIERERFYLITYSLLVPVGLKLVYDGLRGWGS